MTLYGMVGGGMAVLARALFAVEVEGEFKPERSLLYVATHRSHWDVPLLCGALYPHVRREQRLWPWFAVRDDLFLPGFFAHLLPGLAPLGWGIGNVLERRLRCVPVRPATRMRLAELCRAQPELPLDELPHAGELRARAGRLEPRRAGDVLRSRYADVLWRLVERHEIPHAEAAWAFRRAQTRASVERLVALLRSGESLILFPEGTPSRDGRVGPIRGGTRVLVRRGRPQRIVPIALDYERTGARRRVLLRVGDAVPPPQDDIESRIGDLLRRTGREHAYV